MNQAPAGGLGLGNSISNDDRASNTKKPAHVQAEIANLRRDFVGECLLVVAIKASHARENVLLCDDLTAERDIHIAIENLREAASSFRAMERLMAGSAP